MMFEQLKVGDPVFVVPQSRHREAKWETITKVGRKYAYLGDERFYLTTGVSAHGECNARANKCGFDAYPSEDHYQQSKAEAYEAARLQNRLVESFGRLRKLPPNVVAQIHKILDNMNS